MKWGSYQTVLYILFQLAHFKIPKYILFVESFPITVTGKIQKYIMREQSIEKLNLDSKQDTQY